jgi:hypothetical protein
MPSTMVVHATIILGMFATFFLQVPHAVRRSGGRT